MKYAVHAQAKILYRLQNNGVEERWSRDVKKWTPLKTRKIHEALFFANPAYDEVSLNEAQEKFPDAFGGLYEGSENPEEKYSEFFDQVPLTAAEIGNLVPYVGTGKTFLEYVKEQEIPENKQASAHSIWVRTQNQREENPNVGFDTPSEWA